jgi:hypothetical protein
MHGFKVGLVETAAARRPYLLLKKKLALERQRPVKTCIQK